MANITLNSAGSSAADPILEGLHIDVVFFSTSGDVAQVNGAGIDPTSGSTITNSVSGSLSPASTAIHATDTGSYDDTLDQLNIGDNTDLSVDDYIYVGHASITDGIYQIATKVSTDKVTLKNDPFAGGGTQTNIDVELAYVYRSTTNTAPILSDGAGDQNFFKFKAEDAGTTETFEESDSYVRDAPSGSVYVAINGVSYTGQTISTFTPSLAILTSWTNQGGISHVSLSGADYTWTVGGGQAEKTLADAETSGLTISATDGAKTGTLNFHTASGGPGLALNIDNTVDTTGPNLGILLRGVS